MSTLAADMQAQAAILTQVAESIERRGYAMVVHGLNRDAGNNRFLFGYFSGALENYLKEWARANRRLQPVMVDVWINEPFDTARKLFDHKLKCQVRFTHRPAHKAIVAALGLVARDAPSVHCHNGRVGFARTGHDIELCKYKTFTRVNGYSRAALQIVLRHLEMPHFCSALTGAPPTLAELGFTP